MKKIVAMKKHLESKIQIDIRGCWNWTGTINEKGYALYFWQENGKSKHCRVHRLMYEILVGPIPPGLTLDHLCRNRRCVNPSHLEAVTHKVNVLRGISFSAVNAKKTHCIRGHEFTSENTYLPPGHKNYRVCRACISIRQTRYLKRKMKK